MANSLSLILSLIKSATPGISDSTVVTLIIVSAIFVIGVLVVLYYLSQNAPNTDGRNDPLRYGNFFVVAIGITAVLIGYLVAFPLLISKAFEDPTQVLAILTAFFGAIVGLVGTFFGVKASSDAAAGAHKLAAASGGDTTPPQVLRTNPSDQDKDVDPNIRITATFSKDMDRATINPNTFKLLDSSTLTPVPPAARNGVTYDQLTKVATFIPGAALGNGRRYGATITSDVKDNAGNALAQDKAWHFTVANGQQGGGDQQAGGDQQSARGQQATGGGQQAGEAERPENSGGSGNLRTQGGTRMEEKVPRPDYADRDDPLDGDEEPQDEPTDVNPLDSETSAATEEELEQEKKEHGVEKEPEIDS